jgi:hypothetical protein
MPVSTLAGADEFFDHTRPSLMRKTQKVSIRA